MIGTDLTVAAGEEPPLGSHVITPRRGYLHHGIYIGAGRVVHYAGLADGLRGGPVEETSLTRFSAGRPVWVRFDATHFDHREVVRRARSRVGEHRYRLLTNNCEHFCEWCLRGTPHSYQVERWFWWLHRGLRTMTGRVRVHLSGVTG
jgi:Lecithin retinol acyltransferase